MTVQELADAICKSKATVSKFEKGQITTDIETLYDISKVLGIHIEQLLYTEPAIKSVDSAKVNTSFFKGLNQFYAYMFDGRSNSLCRCIFDIILESENNQYKIMMYLNIDSYENYQQCENTYYAISNILML